MVKTTETDWKFSPGIIRKTVATRLDALKVPEIERSRLLSNRLGSSQSRHYGAHDHDDEKRAALEKLHALLKKQGNMRRSWSRPISIAYHRPILDIAPDAIETRNTGER